MLNRRQHDGRLLKEAILSGKEFANRSRSLSISVKRHDAAADDDDDDNIV